MPLIAWDFVVKNDLVFVEKLTKEFDNLWIKYIYFLHNIDIFMFFFIWEVDSDNAANFFNKINGLVNNTIERTHISLANIQKPDWVEIFSWDYNNVLPNDKFISFDITPNITKDDVNEKILKHLWNNGNYKLIVSQKTFVDDYLWFEYIRITLVY